MEMPDTLEPFVDKSAGQPPVRGVLHRPASPARDGLVLTHGAGGNCQTPLLRAIAEAFAASGFTVLRCDLPFRQLRSHGPPPLGSGPVDQEGLKRAMRLLQEMVPGRIFLGGHSYGGRQASMLAAAESSLAAGLLLLSYPLHPPKRPAQWRTAHFPNLRTPALFVSGTRDPFGAPEEMKAALSAIPSPTQLLLVESEGHSLLSKRSRNTLPHQIVDAFRKLLANPQ